MQSLSIPLAAVQQATNALQTQVFFDAHQRPRRIPRYVAELVTALESKYFYWHVTDALHLLKQNRLLDTVGGTTRYGGKPLFYFPAQLARDSLAQKRIRSHVAAACRIINRYSKPEVTDALGKHLEGLVRYELRVNDFTIDGVHTASFGNRQWITTAHTLDIIATHQSSRLAIGVEVKNTIDVIPRDEVETKIRICQFLGLTPVFATRWIKPHLGLVLQAGGFGWMFKTQIYPPGMEELASTISRRLLLPVEARTDIPAKPAARFADWVNKTTSPVPSTPKTS